MSVKEINKLGEEINVIKIKCNEDTESLLNSLPETINIIKSKKMGVELVYFSDYEKHLNIFKEVICKKNRAWGEMIKLIEEFAIKEQDNKPIKKQKRRKK